MGVSRRYPSATRLFGKVTNIADYGAFVELEPGIEGLVHVSEMDWTNKNVAPQAGQLGDEVEVMVLEIDEDKRRISLGMKQCRANPGRNLPRTPSAATASRARSSRSPTLACSWVWPPASTAWCTCPTCPGTKPGEAAVRNYKKGQEVEAIVLAVDVDRERISLGIKQLDGDPFTTFVTVNDKGQTVTGKVKTVDARGAEIDLGEDIVGYLRARKSPRPRGRRPQRAQGRRRSHGRGGERGSQDPQHPAVHQGQGPRRPAKPWPTCRPSPPRKMLARPAWAPCCAPSWTTPTSNPWSEPLACTPAARQRAPMSARCFKPAFTMTRSDLVEELAARFKQLTQRDAEPPSRPFWTPWATPWCADIASRSAALAASR